MDFSIVDRFRFRDFLDTIDLSRLRLFVSGIEVTQAIQYYHADQHLTDAADRGGDNAIRLVASKPAWVRVYVESLLGGSISTASLEVQRRHDGFLWSTVATLAPQPPVLASASGLTVAQYAATRGTLGATLNFIIPASEMIGTLRLIARVSGPSHTAEYTTQVEVTLRQTLRLAGVMIAYDGPASSAANAPNLQIAAPVLADLQAMSATALTLFPVQSTADFRSAGSITLTNHLQDTTFPTSGCGAGWDALHAQVVNARTADGNQAGWIYYGLLPTGVPMGPVGGCGGGGVAVGPINRPGTLAHEAGHACGLEHAPSGGAPNPDPNYPAYEPYDPSNTPQASIGEYGLDVNNGIISSPQTTKDFMSYSGPSWISLYHYGRLLSNATLNPVTVGIDHFWWKDLVWEEMLKWPRIPLPDPPPFSLDLELPMYPPSWEQQDVISLIVRVARGKVAQVMHVARTKMRAELDLTAATPFTARLRDEQGRALAEAPLLRLVTAAYGCGCSHGGRDDSPPDHYLAQALVPNVAPGASLAIDDGTDVVWERKAPERRVEVDAFDAKLDRKGKLRLAWRTSPEADEYWVRYSVDGERWQSLLTGATGREAQVDADRLPAGKVMLQLVAHDGFHSTESKPVRIKVPERMPAVAILHPVDGRTYAAGQALRLWGSAVAAEGGPAKTARATWWVGKRAVGEGLDAWSAFEPGRHKLTLRVEDKSGTAEASVSITVAAQPEAPKA